MRAKSAASPRVSGMLRKDTKLKVALRLLYFDSLAVLRRDDFDLVLLLGVRRLCTISTNNIPVFSVRFPCARIRF